MQWLWLLGTQSGFLGVYPYVTLCVVQASSPGSLMTYVRLRARAILRLRVRARDHIASALRNQAAHIKGVVSLRHLIY